MGQPVVHFEVMGTDADKLQAFYSELFGWEITDIEAPVRYGPVSREGNVNADGVGIGGGSGPDTPDRAAERARSWHQPSDRMSRSTWRCRISRPRWPRRRAWAARG
jgi:predicted enzyme related to lactoylglutathione lyase